jgi:hypothetical protein
MLFKIFYNHKLNLNKWNKSDLIFFYLFLYLYSDNNLIKDYRIGLNEPGLA